MCDINYKELLEKTFYGYKNDPLAQNKVREGFEYTDTGSCLTLRVGKNFYKSEVKDSLRQVDYKRFFCRLIHELLNDKL